MLALKKRIAVYIGMASVSLALSIGAGAYALSYSSALGGMKAVELRMGEDARSKDLASEWASDQSQREKALWAALGMAFGVLVFGGGVHAVLARHLQKNIDFHKEAVEGQIAMIEALGEAIAKRDSDTGGHNFRVAWISALIGERMGIKGRHLQALIAGSFLHDVGKIGIPDAILLKPGRFVEQEMAIMRTHVALGEEILSRITWLRRANEVVSGHHEKWDGSGYPRALAGEDIPLLARIFAVADVFDALCSRRPYKEPMSFEESMAIIKRDTGTHFDPKVALAFEPIALKVYDTLNGAEDNVARGLVAEVLLGHFGLNSLFE
jgi:HD-GYP domain-containing protein (c-di-GMP phosphodiesterase class II)